MSDLVLSEGIYLKRSEGKFGGGMTYRESVMETLWFPCGIVNGNVELYPVMDNLQQVLMIKETVTAEVFRKEYRLKENSQEIYSRLKETICVSSERRGK